MLEKQNYFNFNSLYWIGATSTLICQTAVAQPIQITDIQLNQTNGGLELIIDTESPKTPEVNSYIEENKFIIELTNVQWLPQSIFNRSNPVEGISLITAVPQGNNKILVTIVGEDQAPIAQLVSTSPKIVFNIAAETATTQAPEPEADEIVIVVTSQKKEELLSETTSSINVITQQQIEDGQINTVESVAANTPNFSVLGTGSRYFSNFTIRGQSNPTIGEGSVGFYVDGVPITDAYSANIDLFDLEQIEVLRGPQGTLYGRNTSGGVINITTEKPNDQQSLKVLTSLGNFNSTYNQLAFNQPLSDNVFMRLSGSYGARDGFIESTTLDRDLDDRNDLALRGQLRWTPSAQWDINFKAGYDLYDDGQQLLVPFNSPNPFQVDYDEEGQFRLKTNTQSLSAVYEGSSVKFTSISSRRFWSQDPYEIDGDYSALPLLVGLARDDQTTYAQEFRLQSNEGNNPWQWTTGVYLENVDRNVDIGFRVLPDAVALFGAPDVGENLQQADLDSTTVALFGQTTYSFTPRFSLTAGLRYEYNSRSMNRERLFRTTGGDFPLAPEIDVEEDWDQILPTFAADYRFSEQLFGYGKIAKGYKGGGFSYATDDPEFVQFDPETSWSYELGLKSSLLDNKLLANLAVFYTQVDNYQIDRAVDAFSTVVFNASEVDIYGAELELRTSVINGFELIAGLGYTNASFSEFIDPVSGANLDNNRVIFTPELSYNLALQYRQPQGGIFSRLELVGSGVVYFNELNTFKQDPYVLLNGTVGYEFNENFGVYLYGRNILDTEYFISAVDFGELGILGAVGEPATWGVRLRAEF
ncbi:MAG: TonB-dependent receptor domain-containing protein [Pleurocapsa sp.]